VAIKEANKEKQKDKDGTVASTPLQIRIIWGSFKDSYLMPWSLT
jgi:hypothetical protein